MKRMWCDLCGKEIVDDQTHMIKKIYRVDNGHMIELMNDEWDQCVECTIELSEYVLLKKQQNRVKE
jgi:hypothetical protein